jgi:hypothetical protein
MAVRLPSADRRTSDARSVNRLALSRWQDNVWLRRVPCTWHAADAISEMYRHDARAEWSGLVVLYPGW